MSDHGFIKMSESKNENKVMAFLKRLRMETEDVRKFQGPYVNSYLRLFIYGIMVFLTGCVFWGWNGIQELLYKAGSFAEVCEGQLDISYITVGATQYIDCGLRKSSINNLYTIAFTAQFTSAAFGGLFMDLLGPKIVFVFSQGVNLVCWLLMCFMPKQKWVLRTVFVLIGLVAETTYMPLLSITNFFPKNASFVISLLGSLRSLSFYMPTMLAQIFAREEFKPSSLYIIGIIYAGVGNLFCGVVGGYLLQWKFDKTPKIPVGSVELNLEDEVEGESLNSSQLIKLMEPPKGNLKQKFSDLLLLIKNAFMHPQLVEYFMLMVCAGFFLTGISFINKAQRELLITSKGESVVDIFKYFNILSFLPAPFLGLLMDKIGPAAVMFTMDVSGFLFYMLVVIDNYYTKLFGCFFYVIALSLCVSGTYCYLNRRFSPVAFGTLLGFVFTFCGFMSLTNAPLYDLAAVKLSHLVPFNFRPVVYGLMGYMAFCSLLSFGLMYISATRKPEHLKVNKSSDSFVVSLEV